MKILVEFLENTAQFIGIAVICIFALTACVCATSVFMRITMDIWGLK